MYVGRLARTCPPTPPLMHTRTCLAWSTTLSPEEEPAISWTATRKASALVLYRTPAYSTASRLQPMAGRGRGSGCVGGETEGGGGKERGEGVRARVWQRAVSRTGSDHGGRCSLHTQQRRVRGPVALAWAAPRDNST